MVRAGWHVSKTDLYSNLKDVCKNGGQAAQVYMSSNQRWAQGAALTDKEVSDLQELCCETGLYLVCHGKLLLNLCHDEISGPRVMPALISDMQAAARIGADVVIHQGKNLASLELSREEALTRFVLNVQSAIDSTPELNNRILLENSCQQGTELGYSLKELTTIWRLLEPEYRTRVGFCLDTCHAHVGGMMDIADPDSVEEVFAEFDNTIGLEHLHVIHFNDSEVRFDGHNDSHANILLGYGGNPGLKGNSDGLRKVVEIAHEHDIPLILETPGSGSADNAIPIQAQLQLILGWAAGGTEAETAEKEYLTTYREPISSFASNPRSKKGRKKKVPALNPRLSTHLGGVPPTKMITPIIVPKVTIPRVNVPVPIPTIVPKVTVPKANVPVPICIPIIVPRVNVPAPVFPPK